MRYSLRREPRWNADRRARSEWARAASQDAAVVTSVCRRSASPSFLREDKSKWRVVDSEADFPNSRLAIDETPTRIALRERLHSSAPALAGEGDHWSSRSERTVVEGAQGSPLVWRRKAINVGADISLNCLRSR